MHKRLLRCLAVAVLAATCFAQDAARDKSLEIDRQVRDIVADWEQLPGIFDDIEVFSAQVKKLTEIGPEAVPALCMELERTTRDVPLRLIPFTLRAIGDARAVPALIRAIPKTLRPPGSDCGMSVSPADLLRFMQSHDVTAAEGWQRHGSNFDMARPVREVATTLYKLTGHRLNERQIMMTFLEGGEPQRALQRKAYYDVARDWAAWWEKNWKQFVKDGAYAEVRLPAFGDQLPARLDGIPAVRIATGPNIRTTSGAAGVTVSPVEGGRNCAMQIALNRTIDLPAEFKEKGASNSFEAVAAWAGGANVDLLGAQYQDQSGKSFYCLRAVGLQAWEIENDEWKGIEAKLQSGMTPELKRPVTDYLMHFDAAQGRYLPEKKATFLFVTREGVQGILRVVAQSSKPVSPASFGMPYVAPDESGSDQRIESGFEKGVKFDYQFFYTETDELRREELARKEERASRDEARRQKKLAKLFAENPSISGVVHLPDGGPASNASVALGYPEAATILGERKFLFPEQTTMVQTAEDGKFVLPRAPKAHHIYVAHEKGFAEVDLGDANSPVSIDLKPWGRLEGKMIRQGKPAAQEKVAIYFPSTGHESRLCLSPDAFGATTDAEGRFVIENLPPGEFHMCRVVGNRYHEAQLVEIEAGTTTVFEHVLNGRKLKGRFVASDGSKADWADARSFRFTSKPPAQAPKGYAEISKIADFNAAREKVVHASFPVWVREDGQFEIQNVPAGVYEFRGELREGGNEPFRFGKVLGRLNREIVVAEANAPEGDDLPLGELTVEMEASLNAGDVAPDFEVKATDGGTLRLADFRGKYVLLDFWATWCGPCRAEMPNMKEIFATYGADKKFAMIGLSLDQEIAAPKNYAKTEGLGWKQGFLGEWSATKLPSQYGVQGIPMTFLIDPEGKIVATDLRGKALKDAVNDMLIKR